MTSALAVELARALLAAGLPLPSPLPPSRPPASASISASASASGPPATSVGSAALDWASSGLMWLTGRPGQPPSVPDAPVLARARAAADLLGVASAALGAPVAVDVPELLGGRAALLGLRRAGAVSANGGCRLLRAADGWVAVNLPRPDDVDAVPALLGAMPADILADARVDGGSEALEAAWAALALALPHHSCRDLTERAWLLGLPLAPLPPTRPDPFASSATPTPRGAPFPPTPAVLPATATATAAAVPLPVRLSGVGRTGSAPESGSVSAVSATGGTGGTGGGRLPLLVDLSSLWAGPLAAHLLGRTGMRVVKVESTHRPDGARLGDPDFYRWLHAGHENARFDFTTEAGRTGLRQLVEQADVVIEGSRPRALAQLGLDADRWVAARPRRVWLSITGYGRRACSEGPGAGPVAFGDDAAVAGGLVAWDRTPPDGPVPVFCGDAIGDPLTGLYAALAVALCRAGGIGALVDVAMRDVTAFVAGPPPDMPPPPHPGTGRATRAAEWPTGTWSVTGSDEAGWTVHQDGRHSPVRPPRRPPVAPDTAVPGTVDPRAVVSRAGGASVSLALPAPAAVSAPRPSTDIVGPG